MESVAAGPRGCTYYSAGRTANLCWVVAGEHGELLDCVDTQIDSEGAARRAVGIVVHADAVQARIVLTRPPTGDGHLRSKTIFALPGGLRASSLDSRLKRSQIGGRTPIQGELEHALRVDDPADG